MYRYLLFDLDGTLTDPKEGITRSVQHALRRFGIEEPDTDRLTPFIGPPLTESFQKYYGLSEEDSFRAVDYYRERFSVTGLFENEVLPGIPETLEVLSGGGKILAVASSKPELFVNRILEKFGLAQWFAEVTGATMDERTRTTKPEVIRECLKRLGIPEEEKKNVLMIGDRRHDVEGAQACGLDSLGVYFGYAEEGELEKAGADFIVSTVPEMKAFLLSH